MITGAVSILGGALSFLLSPIGLIGAAFVAAGLLIWRYWEPIKAFFLGVFTGVMQAISPLRDTFATFSPIFDMISDGVKSVWQWFTNLLSPVQTSKETLDKCTSAGEIFGNVLGGAINLVLTPAKMLLDTLGWILEKLGVLPDEAERARKKIEDAQRSALLQDKVAFLAGDMAKVAPKKQSRQLLLAHHLRPRHCQEIPVRKDVCKASQTIQKQPLTTPRKSGRVTLFSKTCRVLWLCVAHIRKRALRRNQYREWQRPQLAALFQRQQPHRPRYQLPLPLRPAAPQFLTLPLTMLVSARIRSWKE
ncbi:Phage-related minor tail protein [Yokenella regensburgei]|nr:Phage-related minor tail protein [Yokenella regensburgei]